MFLDLSRYHNLLQLFFVPVQPYGFRGHSEGVYNSEGKVVDVDFRRLEKIHCEGVIVWWILDGQCRKNCVVYLTTKFFLWKKNVQCVRSKDLSKLFGDRERIMKIICLTHPSHCYEKRIYDLFDKKGILKMNKLIHMIKKIMKTKCDISRLYILIKANLSS